MGIAIWRRIARYQVPKSGAERGRFFTRLMPSLQVALDVGSPVVCSYGGEERHELTGMLTMGDVCARNKRPRPVTKVLSHLDWIEEEYARLW